MLTASRTGLRMKMPGLRSALPLRGMAMAEGVAVVEGIAVTEAVVAAAGLGLQLYKKVLDFSQ